MSAKHVALLERAHNTLKQNDTYIFICDALAHADRGSLTYAEWHASKAYKEIHEAIGRNLHPHETLDSWVLRNKLYYPSTNIQYGTEAYKIKIKNTRLAWIDAMIEYWKDKP
jgi:hypothetical protein